MSYRKRGASSHTASRYDVYPIQIITMRLSMIGSISQAEAANVAALNGPWNKITVKGQQNGDQPQQ